MLACALGSACTLQLTGYKLAPSNRVAILGASGSCKDGDGDIADWGGGALVLAPSPSSTDALQTYDVGTPTRVSGTPLVGGDYQLCWAHEGGTRDAIGLFVVSLEDDGGSLSGPVEKQYGCTLGDLCNLQLLGYGLENANRIAVRPPDVNCGDAGAIATPWGEKTGSAEIDTLSATYTFGTMSTGEPGDEYTLCWGQYPSSGDVLDMKVTVTASLVLAGPYIDTDAFACTLGENCRVQLAGAGLDASWFELCRADLSGPYLICWQVGLDYENPYLSPYEEFQR